MQLRLGMRVRMTEDTVASTRDRRFGKRRAVVAGLAVTAAIVAVPLLIGRGGDSSGGVGRPVGKDDALIAVRAAVGKMVASGSYETDFETHSTQPTVPAPQLCPPNASCSGPSGASTFDTRGHGIVNFDPYISRSVTDTSVGPRTLYVTSTTVWLSSGDAGGTIVSGVPLSSFASTVEGSLGPSEGALAMIALASPGGSLNLEEEAVADATPAGTGSVDGTDVTYYDVTIDMTKLADTPDLNDAQRETVQAALPLLRQGGYTGTTERIGVDAAGWIREVTATNHFDDGSTGTRHTTLSNFGCAPRISPPNQPAPAVTTPSPCPAPDPTATTSPPTSTSTPSASPTTTSPPVSSTTSPVADASDTDVIRAAFLGWIDAQPKDAIDPYVEDYASIQDSIRQGMAQHSPEDLAKYSGRVDSITLVDPTHAAVVYSILFDGTPQYAERQGQAIKIDGVWKVSRDTVCALLSLGGITCPPRTTNTPAS